MAQKKAKSTSLKIETLSQYTYVPLLFKRVLGALFGAVHDRDTRWIATSEPVTCEVVDVYKHRPWLRLTICERITWVRRPREALRSEH